MPISEDGLAELVAHGHLPSQVPICQVEHGVRPSALSVTDPAPSSPPEKTGPARILVLGRVHPVKNLELALSSLATLRKDRPEVTLQIAGPVTDRDYLAKLQALADSLGLKDAVQWLGLVGPEEKARLLSQATVLWLCSHMESFGVVVVEALASLSLPHRGPSCRSKRSVTMSRRVLTPSLRPPCAF